MPSVLQQVLLMGNIAEAEIAFIAATGNETELTTYTFAGQSLGVENSARKILVVLSARSSDGAARTISSVTVAGITATAIATQHSSGNTAAIYSAAVPTGTTGDVVVTWSSTMARTGIGVYRALNIASAAEATGVSTANPLTSNLSVSEGSVQVAVGHSDNSTTATWSGTNGLTEDYDQALPVYSSGASRLSPSAVTVTATCTWALSTRPVYAAASFAKA